MHASWEVHQLIAKGRRFPPGTPVSSANKTDRQNMTQDVESGVKHQSIQSNPSLKVFDLKIEKKNMSILLFGPTLLSKEYYVTYPLLLPPPPLLLLPNPLPPNPPVELPPLL